MRKFQLLTLFVLFMWSSNSLWSQFLSHDPIYFPENVYSPPFVANDQVYAITGKTLHCLTPVGKEKWAYVSSTESIYSESLCSSGKGEIYFATHDEVLHCIDTSGNDLWTYKMRDLSAKYRDGCHIVYTENNEILVSSADSFLYVLNAAGDLQWEKKFPAPFANKIAYYSDSVIYCCPYRDTVVYAVDFAGEELWTFYPGYETFFSKTPAVNAKGDVCFFAKNGYGQAIWVLDKKGETVYYMYPYFNVNSDPWFTPEGNLLYGSARSMICWDTLGNKKWDFETNDQVYSSPRTGPDDNIYFGSDDGHVYCLDQADGTKISSYKTNNRIRYPVDFTSDGHVFFLIGHPAPFSVYGKLNSFSNLESADWSINGRSFHKSPAISSDGTVVVCSMDSVFAFNEGGVFLWDYDPQVDTLEIPVIFDNTVIITSRNNMTALQLDDGSFKWSLESSGQFHDSPGIGPDGSIYLGSTDGHLYAYSETGIHQWTYQAEGEIIHAPATNSNGDIVFCCQNGYLYSLDASGKLTFKTQLPSADGTMPYLASHSPTIDGSGNIYVGTEKNSERRAILMSYSPSGSQRWERGFRSDRSNFRMLPPTFDTKDYLYFRFGTSLYSYDLDGGIRWIDENGLRTQWIVNVSEGGYELPSVDSAENVYVSTSSGNIYKVNSNRELPWVYNNAEFVHPPSPLFIRDGGKYYFTADSKMSSFTESSGAVGLHSKHKSNNGNTNMFVISKHTNTDSPGQINKYEIQLYPNPVKDKLFVTWTNPAAQMDLSIFNIEGKLVLWETVYNGAWVQTGILNTGIYLVKLVDETSSVYFDKIIVE